MKTRNDMKSRKMKQRVKWRVETRKMKTRNDMKSRKMKSA